MVTVTFTDNGIHYDKNVFYQYDYGEQLQILGLNLPEGAQVHFAKKGMTAIVLNADIDDNGNATVTIPTSILKYDGEFNVYVYIINSELGYGKTAKSINFNVLKREIPSNYNPPEDLMESLIFTESYINEYTPIDDTEARLTAVEDALNKLILNGLRVE